MIEKMGLTNEHVDVLSALTQRLEINIKICLDEVKDRSWNEYNAKKDYDLWIVTKGQVQIKYCGDTYIMQPMDAFLIYPETLYRASALSDECRFIFIHFDANIGSNRRALNDYNFDGFIRKDAASKEIDMFMKSYAAYVKKEAVSELYLKGCFYTMLAGIIQYKFEKNKEALFKDSGKQSVLRFIWVLKYIDSNFNRNIYMKELADIMHISEKYFITHFKNVIGIPPARYILELRMKKALEYLNEKKYSVKEVAAMVGYDDQYTFQRYSKKLMVLHRHRYKRSFGVFFYCEVQEYGMNKLPNLLTSLRNIGYFVLSCKNTIMTVNLKIYSGRFYHA